MLVERVSGMCKWRKLNRGTAHSASPRQAIQRGPETREMEGETGM